MGEIILIGTGHLDPKGEKRLEKLLEYTSPEILTIESSKKRRKLLEKTQKTIKDSLEKKGLHPYIVKDLISKTVGQVYEWRVTKDYSKKCKIPLYEIDLPNSLPCEDKNVRNEIIKIKDMFQTDKDIELFLIQQEIAKKDPLTLKLFDTYSYSESCLNQYSKMPENWEMMGGRDDYMAEKLTKIIKKNPEKKVAHVGGALHMFKSENFPTPSLYMLLAKDNPSIKVYYLPDAGIVV
ncbi:MAG: hypothetical protein Q8O03_03565 [Nanoarchaeota archaeon]|nr:hypothetical protein [Nanoarchaeota archaeon]